MKLRKKQWLQLIPKLQPEPSVTYTLYFKRGFGDFGNDGGFVSQGSAGFSVSPGSLVSSGARIIGSAGRIAECTSKA